MKRILLRIGVSLATLWLSAPMFSIVDDCPMTVGIPLFFTAVAVMASGLIWAINDMME